MSGVACPDVPLVTRAAHARGTISKILQLHRALYIHAVFVGSFFGEWIVVTGSNLPVISHKKITIKQTLRSDKVTMEMCL